MDDKRVTGIDVMNRASGSGGVTAAVTTLSSVNRTVVPVFISRRGHPSLPRAFTDSVSSSVAESQKSCAGQQQADGHHPFVHWSDVSVDVSAGDSEC